MTLPEGESIVDRVVNGETSRQERTRQKGAVCFEFERDGERTRARIAQDVDPSHPDAITTSEPDAREYADELPKHPLPGTGEERVDCGRPIPELGCRDCLSTKDVGRTCRNPDCPRCNKSWAFHRAVNMGAKLHDLAKKVPEQVFKHHLTVSFANIDARFNSQDPLKRGRQAINVLLQMSNVETGFGVYHPWRIAKEYRGDVMGHESGDGDMTWKDVLELVESEAWSWEAVREEFLVYAPHFHVICLSGFVDTTGQDLPGVGEIEDKTGVVIHRITTKREDDKERSIADVDELAKVLGYSLSHAGITPESEKQTHRADVRAFGQVANHDVGKEARSRMEVKSAMRRVAPKVLGIEFPEPECHEHVPKQQKDDSGSPAGPGPAVSVLTDTAPSGSGSGSAPSLAADDGHPCGSSDSWSETSGSVPSGLNVATSGQTEPCNGKMVPLWKLESKLGDLGELKRIKQQFGEERIHEFRHQVERRKEILAEYDDAHTDAGVDPPEG